MNLKLDDFFFLKNKKVLITGSSGFIGSYLSKECKRNGAITVGIDINKPKNNDLFEYFVNDTINDKSLTKIFSYSKYDYIFHLAGSASVQFSFDNPVEDFNSLVSPTVILINFISKFSPDCKFLTFSSAAVYGNPKHLPISESAVINPISPYGLHKSLVEKIIHFYSSLYNINCVIFRIFSAYGVGLKKQIFWDVMKRYIKNKNKINLFGTGNETRDYIHVSDIVRASFFVLKHKNNKLFDVYNLANGDEVTIKYAVQVLFKNADKTPNLHFHGDIKVGNPVNWKADISKLKSIGFEPIFKIENELENYYNWFVKNKND